MNIYSFELSERHSEESIVHTLLAIYAQNKKDAQKRVIKWLHTIYDFEEDEITYFDDSNDFDINQEEGRYNPELKIEVTDITICTLDQLKSKLVERYMIKEVK